MTNKQYYILSHQEARRNAASACMTAPDGYVVEVKQKTRTLEQNARLWAMLNEISSQVEWYGRKLSAEDWKHVFTAALKKQDVVPNLDGSGFVILGQSTSKMTKSEMGDLMELMTVFGIENGVEFHEQNN